MILTNRYKKQVIKRYRYLPLANQDIPLEQVFVKLKLSLTGGLNFEEKQAKLENRLSAEIERREFIRHHTKQPPKTVTLSVASALHKYRRLLVIGGPGSGKTMLVRWLALTFARNEQAERLYAHLGKPRLPILLELRHFYDRAETLSEQPTVPDLADEIANYISQRFVDIEPDFIHEQLAQGQCLLLIDGLDEIRDLNTRRKMIRAINALFQCPDGAYQDNLCLITSRSHGYTETKLGATLAWREHFKNADIKPFTMEDVSLALRRSTATATGTNTTQKTTNLLETISENKQVTKLAINPLLCTMIAIVYRNNRKLPNRRIELYSEYCNALLKPYNKVYQPSGLIAHYNWQTKLELLDTLAYWLHHRERLTAPFDSFVSQLGQILINYGLKEEAPAEAHRFLVAIRDYGGILQQEKDGSLSFSHRTIQEYFAARHIAAQPQQQIILLVMPHLHDAWWREVHLLVIGHLGSTNTTAPQAAALLSQILTVYRPLWPHISSYSPDLFKWCENLEYLFKKEIEIDIKYIISVVMLPLIFVVMLPLIFFILISQLISLLLVLLVHTFPKWQLTRRLAWALGREFELAAAGYAECAYTTPALDQLLNDKAIERLLYVMSEPLYDQKENLDLQRSAKQIWEHLGYARVIDVLVKALTNSQCHIRRAAAHHLGQLGQANSIVVDALMIAVSDRDLGVRKAAAESLVQLEEANSEIVKPFFITLANRNHEVREAIISNLGESGKISPQVINDLLTALTDSNSRVVDAAINSLVQLDEATEQILMRLLERLTDEELYIRRAAACGLGQLGRNNLGAKKVLLTALTDEESKVRESAAHGLGESSFDTQVVKSLLIALADKESTVRKEATHSLGQSEASEQVVSALLTTLSDDEDIWVRRAAAGSLGELGQASPQVISGLLAAFSDRPLQTTVASSLMKLDGTNPKIIERIQAKYPKWRITQTKTPTNESAESAESATHKIQDESMLYLSLVMTNKHLYDWDLNVNRLALEVIRKSVTGRSLPNL